MTVGFRIGVRIELSGIGGIDHLVRHIGDPDTVLKDQGLSGEGTDRGDVRIGRSYPDDPDGPDDHDHDGSRDDRTPSPALGLGLGILNHRVPLQFELEI
jgi:hypothetical protein